MKSRVTNLTSCSVSVCGYNLKPYDSTVIDLPKDYTYNNKTLAVSVIEETIITKDVPTQNKRRRASTATKTNNEKESE